MIKRGGQTFKFGQRVKINMKVGLMVFIRIFMSWEFWLWLVNLKKGGRKKRFGKGSECMLW